MVYILMEKLMNLVREIYSSEVDDEIIYTIDELNYNDDDYELLD
jgi:hypothetical protein